MVPALGPNAIQVIGPRPRRRLARVAIQVSMCGDLLNVLLKKSFSSQSLVLGYTDEFMCQQPKISRAVSANDDAVPRRQTSALGRPRFIR
jgi:hypothetical protein